jgi:PTH2 family peptidyl-tRNA hydrolase
MYKQVIIVRDDLNMSRGKLAGQVAHAAVAACKHPDCKPGDFSAWYNDGKDQAKIILAVSSEDQLMNIFAQAMLAELPFALVFDQGKTELPPDTLTCLGIGPAKAEIINKITSSLPLLK